MIKRITNYKLLITNWIKANRKEAFVLAVILLIGAFFRLYRIDEYMTFLGDEGRDAIVVRRLLVNFDPILVGPGTSIGDMYLGPLYYYMMAPALFLANFSPVGPAVMVALLGVATIFLTWWVAREWFGKLVALIASLFYALSPVVIYYSRSSWNPNIMPFFALLSIYSIWRVWQKHEFKWLIALGVSFAFVLQSHYLGLLLAPVFGLFWLLTFLAVKNKNEEKSRLFKLSLISFVVFALLMSPLVLFDARHGFRNFSAMKKFFTERQTTISVRPWSGFSKILPISQKIITRLIDGTNLLVGLWTSLLLAFGILLIGARIISGKDLNKKVKSALFLLSVWLTVALVGLSVYKQEIYDHYYGFFFPAPFILLGVIVSTIIKSAKEKIFLLRFPLYLAVFVAFVFLALVNIRYNPLQYPPNRQLQRTVEVADKIIKESKSWEFNLAVIAERNYEGAYQYFLEKDGAPLIIIDPQRADVTITDQLFVVCELPKVMCDPTHNPKAQVANFGWSKIEGEWEVGGTTLYKLVHVQ